MNNNTNEPNRFSRTLIVVLSIFIAGLISANFFYFNEPKGVFTNGSLVLIGILTILVLAEIFDSLTLGKFISLKRNYNEKKEELTDVKAENEKLRSQIISIATSINQSQSNTNIIGGTNDKLIDKLITYVIQANKEEVAQKKEEEKEDKSPIKDEIETPRRRIDFSKIENDAIDKYLSVVNISPTQILKEVKLAHRIKDLDPVSNSDFIYDGYIEDTETFIEVKLNRISAITFRDRLYSMLTKILYYRAAKKVDASLTLILVNIPEEQQINRNMGERLTVEFDPAIKMGLLKIDYFNITEDKINEYYKE